MTDHDINILHRFFNVEPIQTRGIGNGYIIKLSNIQLKIYEGLSTDMYQIQAFENDTQLPFLVIRIPTRRLKHFLETHFMKKECIMDNRFEFHCIYHNHERITIGDCDNCNRCPYCDLHAFIKDDICDYYDEK